MNKLNKFLTGILIGSLLTGVAFATPAAKMLFWEQVGSGVISPIDDNKMDISAGLTASYLTSVEQLTDGGFENWSITGYSPDSWDMQRMGGTAVERSTDSHAGTYAAKLTSDSEFDGLYISDLFTGGSADGTETLQLKVWGKRLTGEANVFYAYSYPDGEDEYYYNFTGANIGTWTVPVGGMPAADQLGSIALTTSYSQAVGTEVTVPEGKTGASVSFGVSSSVTGATAVIDNVEILVATVDEAVNGDFEAWSPIEGLDDWETGQTGDDHGIGAQTTFTKESSVVQSGTYSIKSTGDNGNYSFVGQLIEGTADESLDAHYYARGDAGNAGSPATKMLFLNEEIASATHIWNHTGNVWELVLGEYFSWDDDLDSDNVKTLAINNSEVWTQSAETLTIPATGKVYMIVYTEIPGEDIVYVDSASIQKEDTGYGPLMSVNSTTGKVTFDGEIAAQPTTSDDGLVNLGQLKETGVTLLGSGLVMFHVQAGYTIYESTDDAIPLFVVQVCEESDNYSSGPTWSMGTNAEDYNNMITSGTGSPAGEKTKISVFMTGGYILEAEQDVIVNVTIGSTATEHAVRFYLFGIKL